MRNSKNPKLTLIRRTRKVYRSKIDIVLSFFGLKRKFNYWYVFRDLEEMPYLRSQISDIAKTMHGAKITKESLVWLLEKLKASPVEEKNRIADEIILRTNHLTDEGCLLELCSIYFILNEESIDVFDKVASKEKQDILNTDYKLKCFFLFWLQEMIQVFPTIFPLDIVEYLETPKELKNEIARQQT